jgi:hypothetical protein
MAVLAVFAANYQPSTIFYPQDSWVRRLREQPGGRRFQLVTEALSRRVEIVICLHVDVEFRSPAGQVREPQRHVGTHRPHCRRARNGGLYATPSSGAASAIVNRTWSSRISRISAPG